LTRGELLIDPCTSPRGWGRGEEGPTLTPPPLSCRGEAAPQLMHLETRTRIRAAIARNGPRQCVECMVVSEGGGVPIDVCLLFTVGIPVAHSPPPLSWLPLCGHRTCRSTTTAPSRVQGTRQTDAEEVTGASKLVGQSNVSPPLEERGTGRFPAYFSHSARGPPPPPLPCAGRGSGGPQTTPLHRWSFGARARRCPPDPTPRLGDPHETFIEPPPKKSSSKR